MENLLEKIKKANEILKDDKLFEEIHIVKEENEKLIAEMNSGYKSNEEILEYLEKITGKSIDKSVTISLPFQTDFGKHITFGKKIVRADTSSRMKSIISGSASKSSSTD